MSSLIIHKNKEKLYSKNDDVKFDHLKAHNNMLISLDKTFKCHNVQSTTTSIVSTELWK